MIYVPLEKHASALIVDHDNIKSCIEDRTYHTRIVLKLAPKNKTDILVKKGLYHLVSYLISLAKSLSWVVDP